ncbi:TIGR02452 family protein [Streptomyces sp. NPDC048172]|uniref:TIGR02452 family protein n=1 Tax=Streptomyces sp. NPDC048172 TaxID=3365505 RepID=UPI003715B012
MSARMRALAKETEDIVERGWYATADGRRAEVGEAAGRARARTRLHGPDPLPDPEPVPRGDARTVVEVTGEGSLRAARRLTEETGLPVAVLNFASARNPGGGYLNGAQAQEEALCRGSALYRCLREAPDFYAAHRADRSPFYSDRVIHSPGVPVFRDDAGTLLEAPFTADFLTSPAPNAGVVARQAPDRSAEVPAALRRRAGQVLRVAAASGARALVLGAWGCGVFRNRPADVAAAFDAHLRGGGPLTGAFDHVTFAVLDRREPSPTREPFRAVFGPESDAMSE